MKVLDFIFVASLAVVAWVMVMWTGLTFFADDATWSVVIGLVALATGISLVGAVVINQAINRLAEFLLSLRLLGL
jgi:hypothetical protein